MFTVHIDIDGAIHKFDTIAENANDLTAPLRVFGGFLRKKAIERYKAQDFAPLAESTIEKRAQKGLRSMEKKLQRELTRAYKNARRARGDGRGFLARLVNKQVSLATEDAISSGTRGVQNRLAVLAVFQQRHRPNLKERAQGKALTLKQAQGLSMRTVRAVQKAVGAPILGQLPRTLAVTVGPGTMTLRSRTHEEWSAAHNEGATVGHGAKLPKRETIKLEASDLEVFAGILKDHMLLGVTDGD